MSQENNILLTILPVKQGWEKMIISGSDGGRGNKKEINPLSIIDRPFNEKETHNTQKIIAEVIKDNNNKQHGPPGGRNTGGNT